jgi:hypothetical protein
MNAETAVLESEDAVTEASIAGDPDRAEAETADPPQGEGSKWNAVDHGLTSKM